jgi:hypothetical protein
MVRESTRAAVRPAKGSFVAKQPCGFGGCQTVHLGEAIVRET